PTFLLYLHRHNIHLHSFPTRRSSDLSWKRTESSSTRRADDRIRIPIPLRAIARVCIWREFWWRECTPTKSSSKTAASTAAKSRKDRKSTRLNSSHVSISYAVFCLKKK